MKFPNPKEIHLLRNDDGSYTAKIVSEVYGSFGGPKGQYGGEMETTIKHCHIHMKLYCESGDHEIGGEDGEEKSRD